MIKKTTLFILLFSIFFVSLEQTQNFVPDIINIQPETNNPKTMSTSTAFLLSYSQDEFSKFKQYIKATVTSKGRKNQYVILAESQNCETGRKLLGMQPYGPINIFINKNQLAMSQNLYLCVKCLEDFCSYEVQLNLENSPKLKIGEQYSYYINTTNTNIQFELEITPPQTTENIIYNLWIKGENVATNIDGGDEVKKYEFSHGNMYTIKCQSTKTYNVIVRGYNGDYITIGSIEIKNGVAPGLKVNDNEVMGVLSKSEDIKEICFLQERLAEIQSSDFFLNIYLLI